MNVLLNYCKQNFMSLSLLVGTTPGFIFAMLNSTEHEIPTIYEI